MSRSRSRPFTSCSTCLPIVTKPNHQFLADLLRYSRPNRHNSSFVPPSLCGHNIDLRALYNEVAIRGGHKQVTSLHQWNEVYVALGYPTGCVDAGHGLRTIYQRFLESFERTQRMAFKSTFATDDLESSLCVDTDSQDLDASKGAKQLMPTSGAPSPKAEDIPNHLRASWNLSTELSDRVDYISLERSLQSGLPNEVDFALNTMLLMSSQPNGFSLYKNERLLELLLKSVGIVAPNCSANDYSNVVQHRFQKFWYENISGPFGRIFLAPESFDVGRDRQLKIGAHDSRSTYCFSKLHDMAYGDDEGFRVQLVATVVRNLAVEGGPSAVIIGRDPQALRFIFLCVYTTHSSLRHLGLETLSSLHFPVVGRLEPALQILIPTLMTSSDRSDQMRGLQLIGRLCEAPLGLTRHALGNPNGSVLMSRDRSVLSNDRNAGFLSSLPSVVFERIVKTLCLRDLHLVVLALDTVYNLSCLGRILCERLLGLSTPTKTYLFKHHSTSSNCLLQVLVALLRLEAQAMGSESMIRLRVMQALSSSGSNNTVANTSITNTDSKAPVSSGPKQRLTQIPSFPSSPLPTSTTSLPPPPLSAVASQLLPAPGAVPSMSDRTNPISNITTANPQPNMVPLSLTLANGIRTSAGNTTQASTQILSSLESLPSATTSGSLSQPDVIPPMVSCPTGTQSPSLTPCLPNTQVSTPAVSAGTVMTPCTASQTCTPVIDLKRNENPVQCLSKVTPLSPPSATVTAATSTSGPQTLALSYNIPVDYPNVPPTLSSKQHKPTEICDLTPKTESSSASDLSATIANRLPLRPQFRPHTSRLYRPPPRSRKSQLSLTDKNMNSHSVTPRLEYMFEWLQKNYVVHNHSSVSRVQIYMDYQRAHQRRFGTLTTAVSPVDFHTLIKSVFPGVGQVKVQVPGDKVIIHYNNLRCLHSPESNTEQGVNDIMAAVLSPNKQIEVSAPKRPPKSKSRKRPTPQSLSNVDPVKRMPTWPQSNGHPESKQLVNGCVLETTSNGLTKGLVGLITHPASSGQTNGTVTQAQTSPVKLTASALSPCPKLNELVSREHGLVLFPVFTTLSFNPAASQVSSNHVEKAVSEVPQSASSPDGPVTSTGISQSRLTPPAPTDAVNHDHGIVKSMPVTSKSILTSRPVLARKVPAISSAQDISNLFVCHWNTCSCLFKDLNALLVHLWSEHLSNLAVKQPLFCSWTICDHKEKLENAEQLRAHVYRKHIKPLSADTTLPNGTTSNSPPGTHVAAPRSCINSSSSVNSVTLSTPTANSVPSSGVATSSEFEVHQSLNPSSDDHLFRHPSNSVGEAQSIKFEPRERHAIPYPTVAKPNTPTPDVAVTAQSAAISSVSAAQADSYDAPQTVVLTKPTVWCSPPTLSEECHRAMAGGAPNPMFDLTPPREGPVTKHIRLTAALTLKNLLRFSQVARNFMISREELLSELAFSGLESSPTIFECLIYLNESSGSTHNSARVNLIPPFV